MRPIVKAVGLICILAHYYLIVKMIITSATKYRYLILA